VKRDHGWPGTALARAAVLYAHRAMYEWLLRPVMFRSSAQVAHERMLHWLRRLDGLPWLRPLFGVVHRLAFPPMQVTAGGVTLAFPLILAAGLVKGEGFESETAAQEAVRRGRNIIPGWRCLPHLVGPVEFGSFTRWPRLGNSGTVVWRDVPTCSTQNRIGLKNPGAAAAAAFLDARRRELPAQFGINVAVSPGVDDPAQQTEEVVAALSAFMEHKVYPTWFTLNLSCPNTEDDPRGHQTAEEARQVCGAAVDSLRRAGQETGSVIPLWVKVGPNLGDEQYCALMPVFQETGVQAVIATNTLPVPSPDDPGVMAGVGGGQLHSRTVEVAALLMQEKLAQGYRVDVIGCGGVQDGATYRDFVRLGITVVQYWTALVYRGPLAAALIIHEAGK
jgi:dihydroorotate dehydrogenase